MSNYEYIVNAKYDTNTSDTLFSLKESQEIIGDRNEILPTKIPSVNDFENLSLSSSTHDKINNSDVNISSDDKVEDCLELPQEEFDIEANTPIQEPLPVQTPPPVEVDEGIPRISLLPFSMIFFPIIIIIVLTRK